MEKHIRIKKAITACSICTVIATICVIIAPSYASITGLAVCLLVTMSNVIRLLRNNKEE